jgi:hypothetical protein
MSEEIHELHEHAEHAKHDPSLAPVTLTMAILAVLVAVASLMGHRAHTEEVLKQAQASDKWAYYQAKDIRRHADDIFTSQLGIAVAKNEDAAEKFAEKYKTESERYRDETKKLESEARELEAERDAEQKKANRFDLGEVLLEIALVVTSITLMTGKKAFWLLGLLSAALGLVSAVSGLLLS